MMNYIRQFTSRYKQNNESISIYLIPFLIPLFPKLLGLASFLFFLELIVSSVIFKTFSIRKSDFKIGLLSMILFFLLHVLGLFNSSNQSFAWMDIGMKTSFILFPVFFILFKPNFSWKKIGTIFLIGAFASVCINVILSTIEYIDIQEPHVFRESYFSHFMHRSYWATYLAISVLITLYFLLFENSKRKIIVTLILIIQFIATLLTGSKMGMIILFLLSLSLIISWIVCKKKYILGFLIIIGLSLITVFISIFSPSITERITSAAYYLKHRNNLNFESTESNTARVFMWETSVELIKENWLTGVGTGDVKIELKKRNLEKGYTGVAEKEFNAHNQFLNTFVAIGLTGFLALIGMFILPFFQIQKPYLLLKTLVLLALFLSLIPESFIETQAGIIPVAFLLCLFNQATTISVDSKKLVKPFV